MPALYRRKSSYPLVNARENLSERTHYVDADTLRYFRARVLSTHATDDGLLFAITESASGDHQHKTRIFRHVIFDIFGAVIDRPNLEGRVYKSQDPARKAMWRALETIDADAVTRAAIESHRASFEREMTDLLTKIDARHDQTKAA
jgi:hypothetical protein